MIKLEHPIIIAIDGYSSTGKSTFAKMIAKEYGLFYLDSGALYRAVTLFALENGLIGSDAVDIQALRGFLGDMNVHFEYSAKDGSLTYIGGRNVESEIRSMEVSSKVSSVSSDPYVRKFVDNILHSYGRNGNVVMDGRDIGTTVFPNADIKIFMTASLNVRARRRADELASKGVPCDMDDVMKNLQERDWADSHRDVSPLVKADDAIVLDNSWMTMEEQMKWFEGILKKKFDESRN